MDEKKIKKLLEDVKSNLKEQQKILDNQQNLLDDLRSQIIQLEKKIYPQTDSKGAITKEALDVANLIIIGEFFLEVDMNARIVHALNRFGSINTLEDLYYLNIENPKYIGVRNLGEKSIEEIHSALSNMDELILRIERRRRVIYRHRNELIQEVLDNEIATELQTKYGITTIYDLYSNYTKARFRNSSEKYCSDEKIITELLRKY